MQTHTRLIIGILLLLMVATGVGILLTSEHNAPAAKKAEPNVSASFVDQSPLETAQKMAALAVTPAEQAFAKDALRLGDRSVDLAFTLALRYANLHPPKLSAEAKQLAAKISTIEQRMKVRQDNIARLTPLIAKASEDKKEALQQQLDFDQAVVDLQKDELEDAHQDLIRAGGDPQSAIQAAIDEHEATEHQAGGGVSTQGMGTEERKFETTTSPNAVAQVRAWSELESKRKQLGQAQAEALAQASALSALHDSLEKHIADEKAQSTAFAHKGTPAEANGMTPEAASAEESTADDLSTVKRVTEDQQFLAGYDKRIEYQQQLAAVYGNWIGNVWMRQQGYLHGILFCVLWILMIALLVMVSEPALQRVFSRFAPERKTLHSVRSVVSFSVRVVGLLLALLVILGPPSQLATVLALAGAGVTVVMKDFIVGFFGWFVLMGRNGIRPGDWVEINGVGGEVLEVNLLHTVLLETGNWSDAGHPTGRKVTFVNSYAIEGHYFNFSTSGQWIWDELQAQVPLGSEPYRVAEAIQKAVSQETEPAARAAEQEWKRLTPSYNLRTFSATPVMSVAPSGSGVNVKVRYLTRAHERHDLRERLNRAVLELLHAKPTLGPQKTEEAAV